VKGDLVGIGNEIRDKIKAAIDKANPFGPLIWDGVKRVGWKIPCNNYNKLSGYIFPTQPPCWDSPQGSDIQAFPPTLILHHNAADP
jgi:hypothetical protein